VLTLPFKPGTFDAVVSVFGAATDLPEAIRALSALVRQGGTLALTTSDADELPPASDAFWRAVLQVRPAIVETSRTWFVGHTPESMARLLLESDIADADIAHETHHVELATPEDTWRLLEGCGYSRVLARLSVLERDLVEMLTLRPLLEQQVRTVNVGIVYAIART
jgi:hypothetical protein